MRVPLALGRVPMGPPVQGRLVDIDTKPTTEQLMALEAADSRIPLEAVRAHPSGGLFEQARSVVLPADDAAGRFALAPAELVEELRQVYMEPVPDGGGYAPGEAFTHRLISRRMLQVFNSTGTHLEGLNKKGPGNPAYMNPDEMRQLGIQSGHVVEIESSYGRIQAVAKAEADIPAGVVSMSHAWGNLPDTEDVSADPRAGACTNRLVVSDRDFEPNTGMCRMSAIPVNIRHVPSARNVSN
jgi:anaerobic selenocysteine-containing dehydrogenase